MYDPLAGRFHPILSSRNRFLPEDAEVLLFGMDTTDRVVAIEPFGSNEVVLYRRNKDGRTVPERRVTSPWMVSSDLRPFQGRDDADVTELRGEHPFRYLITFVSWDAWRGAINRAGDAGQFIIGPRSLPAQYQLRAGLTLFKEMEYADLRRMQIDLETLSLDPAAPDAGIIMISVRQGNHEQVLVRETTEAELIESLDRIIHKLDPDVIEGHNINGFDFPYLLHRAVKTGAQFRPGRNRSTPRLVDGDRRQRAVYIHGRHVIDTYTQVQRFDVAGNFSRYGLKDVIQQMGLEREDRTFVDRATIAEMWKRGETSRLAAYALDDVRDVDTLSRVIMPTEFFQTQMLPMTFQRATMTGTGRKIDDLMFRCYLAAGHSMPRPLPGRSYPGGYVELVRTGSFGPVVKCDVESLYPSIMIREEVASKRDVLGAFPLLLRDLTTRRLEAKRQVRESRGEDRATWDGLQGSFKILINSFYGYLGFGVGAFNDYAAAERVTLEGQRLIQDVVTHLRELGGIPIEIDTDGVYFSPPEGIGTEAEEIAFIQRISDRLPEGINLAHDGRFQRMLSLKIKTYALLDRDGRMTLTGSALRSRSLERCFQQYIHDSAHVLLQDDKDAARELYFELGEAIVAGTLPIEQISQWTMIREATLASRSRLKQALDANPGLWRFGERIEVYERDDGKLALTTDYGNDENTTHLLRRLRDVAERFRPLYPDDAEFEATFPKLTQTTNLELARAIKPTRQLKLI